MKILSLIPARCGSKGVPNKNIVDVNGKPLIYYSIHQAIQLREKGLVDEVVVSTDCEKIAEISKKYGAQVPFLRPKNIAGDDSKSIEFYLHALSFFEKKGVYFDAVLLLQPTSPIRSQDILEKAINTFIEGDSNSLISIYKEEYINDLVMYKLGKSGCLEALNRSHNKGVRRQEHGDILVRNGSIYLTRSTYLKREQNIISNNPLFVESPKQHSINIDTYEDLELARVVLKRVELGG